MIEYVIGIALISSSVQLPDPAVPALLGLLIVLNAAIAKGSAGAFRLVGRRLHRTLDLVVIGILTFFAFQPWLSIDITSRMLVGAIAFILCFVWFYTDFADQPHPGRTQGATIGREGGTWPDRQHGDRSPCRSARRGHRQLGATLEGWRDRR